MKADITNWDDVRAYPRPPAKSDFERTELNKDKTGVQLDGVEAINPSTARRFPCLSQRLCSDASYGTGAIMAVPGHDRDWEFAKKFGCPSSRLYAGGDITNEAFTDIGRPAVMVNSGFLNGLTVAEAKKTIIEWLEEKGWARRRSTTSCATGYSPVSVTGASLSRS